MLKAFYTTLLILFCNTLCAQSYGYLNGVVSNEFTKEPISFVSVFWKHAGFGVLTDSIGNFNIHKPNLKHDTLVFSYIGFDNVFIPFVDSGRTTKIFVVLKSVKTSREVVVKSKSNRGLRWWKNIVSHKPENNPYKYSNYAYELYNKLELDLNNVNKNSFQSIPLLRQFAFILDNIDSVTEKSPFLPVFITESISDCYRSSKPPKSREIIKAAQTHGLKNESVLQFVAGVNLKINVYDDYISILGKEFISPTSYLGDKYYNYKAADTQKINGEKYFHLFFTPLRDGENVFAGECWIHSTTWALQKITINVSPTADINFVNRMSIIQEFAQMSNKHWIFAKDKVIIDVSPLKKNKLTFIARKTSLYKNVRIDAEEVEVEITKNKKDDEVMVLDSASQKDKSFWTDNRHEELSANEKKVYWMIDTLKQVPLFKTLTNTVSFLVDGHKKYGAIEIGPWFKWLSYNQLEGIRTRFDLGTTNKFNKNLRLSGYLAYGVKDKKFKGKLGFNYRIPTNSGWSVASAYTNDLDNGRVRYSEDDATLDNVFNQILRRKGIPQKFLGFKEFKLGVSKDWINGFGVLASMNNTTYATFDPLPKPQTFEASKDKFINTEAMLRFRYAPGEKSIVSHRKVYKIKTNQPIYELRLGAGLKGAFESNYTYSKINVSVTQKFRIRRWGSVNYNFYAGKIYGDNLPFPLLELHPGNEFYTYNASSFNLMNRFEYFSDKFVGVSIEHNFEKKIINLVPFLRTIKARQFWNVKAVCGNMSKQNRLYNKVDFGEYQLHTLRGKTYIEVGTGFDNIMKFFRIDFVWRFAPATNTPSSGFSKIQPVQNFGIFGSMKFQF
jgi:hypothetical protein